MERNWTHEPWEYHIAGGRRHIQKVGGWGTRIWTDEKQISKEDAERIVACVNACAEIPNPEGLGEAIKALKDYARTVVSFDPLDTIDGVKKEVDISAKAVSALRALGISEKLVQNSYTPDPAPES